MIDIEIRRNGSIVAVLTCKDVPTKGTRLIFGDNEYEIIGIKRFFQEGLELDLPQVHVNHVRSYTADSKA